MTLSGNRAGLLWLKEEYFQGNMGYLGVFKSQGKSKNFSTIFLLSQANFMRSL